MEEYIILKEEEAQRQGQTFDWQTARYENVEYYENKDDSLTDFETGYSAIVLDDATLSCEPTVSPLDNNETDFKISFDESDNEDYMVVFDKNSFSCKIIYVNNLKTDSEDENDKVNLPSSPSPEPTFGYIDDLDFFKDFENEFPAIVYNELKSKLEPLNLPSTLGDRLSMVYTGNDREALFTSHAWRRLFEVRGPLIREFILEFLTTCRMSDIEMGLDAADTLCFQLGGARRRMLVPLQ
ncbi:hypothetical protein Tco_1094159 [Tanacetum coccineum]|uniref:Uncharacterized protein n=1 Tax=Tanacetum coccineum TaxID=301880 RepID=A0ABQ5IES1_9ASTR